MKLISLNTWGGRSGKGKQLEFFASHKDADFFCLQEIWAAAYDHHEGDMAGGRPIDHNEIMTDGLQKITAELPDHHSLFRPHYGDNYGLLMLVSKKYKIIEEGEIFVYKHRGYVVEGDIGNHARNLQYVIVENNGKSFSVCNIHGLWNGKGKSDSEDRLIQSDNILNFINNFKCPVVLCGDFNLRPDTESIKKIEKSGLRNLISEYKVTSTRTSFYTKPEKFADYTFISPGIEVKDFQILPDEVSDHSPMCLVFEVE